MGGRAFEPAKNQTNGTQNSYLSIPSLMRGISRIRQKTGLFGINGDVTRWDIRSWLPVEESPTE